MRVIWWKLKWLWWRATRGRIHADGMAWFDNPHTPWNR